jgi:hypothetical protein
MNDTENSFCQKLHPTFGTGANLCTKKIDFVRYRNKRLTKVYRHAHYSSRNLFFLHERHKTGEERRETSSRH